MTVFTKNKGVCHVCCCNVCLFVRKILFLSNKFNNHVNMMTIVRK